MEMSSKESEMEIEQAVDRVLHNLSSIPTSSLHAQSTGGVYDTRVLSTPIGGEDPTDLHQFVNESGSQMALEAIQKTVADYDSLVTSPQKLTTLQSVRVGSDNGLEGVDEEGGVANLNDSMDETELFQWCLEDPQTEQQIISSSADYASSHLSTHSASQNDTEIDPFSHTIDTYASQLYMDDALIEEESSFKINRDALEQLVSGTSVPDMKQLIVTAPPQRPPRNKRQMNYRDKGVDEDDNDGDTFASPRKRAATSAKARGSKKGIPGLPEHLTGLLGQANLYRARGNDEEALKLSLEIIRQCPSASEPYKTVAAIYDANGDEEKAMQFYTISTHLSSTDVIIWEKLMNYNLKKVTVSEEGSQEYVDALKEASRCCTRAILDCKLAESPECVEDLKRFALLRLQLAEKMGEHGRYKAAMRRYLLLLKDNLDGETFSEMAHRLITLYFDDNEQMKALEVLENLRVFHPKYADIGDLNILLELLLNAKLYGKCVCVACKAFSIQLMAEDSTGGDKNCNEVPDLDKIEFVGTQLKIADVAHPKYKALFIPSDTHLDIKVKLAIGLIHTGNSHLTGGIVHELFMQDNLDDILDMFTDICDAMRDKELWKEELEIWNRLIQIDSFDQNDTILFKMSECFWALDEVEKAVELFKKVLDLNPEHVQCRLNLAGYYKDLKGDVNTALQVLDVPQECEDAVKTDVRIVNMRLDMQETSSDEEYFQTVYDIFLYVFSTVKYFKLGQGQGQGEGEGDDKEECTEEFVNLNETLAQFASQESFDDAAMRKRRKKLYRFKRKDVQFKIRMRLNVSWDKFQKATRFGLKLNRKHDLLYMVVQAAQHNVYPPRTKDLQLFACRLGCEVKNAQAVYYCAKSLLLATKFKNAQAWTLFNIVASFLNDNRAHKFLTHLDKTQKIRNFYKSLFLATNSLESGSYKFALAELSLHFLEQEKNPLFNFLIGILYLHFGSQRFAKQKSTLYSLCIFFLKRYHVLRSNPQESYYNIGRAYHQVELLPQAILYYEKSLQCEPVLAPDSPHVYSTARFAAHNLSRIYLNSGAKVLAIKLLRKYPLE